MTDDELQRLAEQAAERAAHRAMQSMFRTMGIAVATDNDLIQTQADFAWLRNRRLRETKAVAVVVGAILAAFVAAGLAALWKGIATIVHGG